MRQTIIYPGESPRSLPFHTTQMPLAQPQVLVPALPEVLPEPVRPVAVTVASVLEPVRPVHEAPHSLVERLAQTASRFAHSARQAAEDLAQRLLVTIVPTLNLPQLVTPDLVQRMMLDALEKAADEERHLAEAGLEELPDDAVVALPDEFDFSDDRPRIVLPNFGYVYSSRDFIKYFKSPLFTWLDRYRYAAPGEIRLDNDKNSMLQIFRQQGWDFEAAYCQDLKDKYAKAGKPEQVADIPEYKELAEQNYQEAADRRLSDTLQAMREGREWILQGFLRSKDGRIEGILDLMKKVPNKPGETSEYGDYHYEAWDLKVAKKPKREHVLQLALYSDLLAQTQGTMPETFGVIGGDSVEHSYRTLDFYDYYLQIKRDFFALHDTFDPNLDQLPELPKLPDYGRYDTFAKSLLRRRDSLAQVANLSNLHIIRLRAAGITTMAQLAAMDVSQMPEARQELVRRIPQETLARMSQQARLQIASRGPLELMEMSVQERDYLRQVGVHYVLDLAETNDAYPTEAMREGRSQDDVAAMRKMASELKMRAAALVAKLDLHKPKLEVIPADAENPSQGLAALPPASQYDIVSDFEGVGGARGQMEYLLGGVEPDGKGGWNIKEFWSHDFDQEKKSFEALIDWWYGTWQSHPEAHVYHYAPYETTAIKRLAAKYGTRESEVDALLNNHVIVDVYRIVKQGLVFGASSYSLKKVELLWRDKRGGDVTTALGSYQTYNEYSRNPDGATWQESPKLKGIRDYWVVDNISLAQGVAFLRDLQREHGIAYVDPREAARIREERREEQRRERDEARNDARRHAQEQFHKRIESAKSSVAQMIADNPGYSAERKRILELLSDLTEFHTRESRPVLADLRRRHEMTQQQLIDDPASLGGLTREIAAPFLPSHDGNTLRPLQDSESKEVDGNPRGGVLQLDDRARYRPENEKDADKPSRSRSWIYTYRFRPEDPPKIDSNTRYEFVSDKKLDATIDAIDAATGNATLKVSAEQLSQLDKDGKYAFSYGGTRYEAQVAGLNPLMGTVTFSFKDAPAPQWQSGESIELNCQEKLECHTVSVDWEQGFAEIKFGPKILNALKDAPPKALGMAPRYDRSMVFFYRFDPAQDTKLAAGDICFIAHYPDVRCEIEAMDDATGMLSLKLGPTALKYFDANPPEVLGLIPDEFVSARVIQESVLRTVERLIEERDLPPNLVNLLRKEPPKIKGQEAGTPIIPVKWWRQRLQELLREFAKSHEIDKSLIPEVEQFITAFDPSNMFDVLSMLPHQVSSQLLKEAVFNAIKNLDHGTLCIQGPPGTGKTYHTAQAIAQLFKASQDSGSALPRIGVSAVSHESISHLMQVVEQECVKLGVDMKALNALKIGGNDEDPLFDSNGVDFKQSAGAVAPMLARSFLVGGTAWAFSNPKFAGEFDYLFIDEASQMPMANVVGMAASTKNLVLVGDQMQLPAPITGAHPRESGDSVMEYYLAGEQAISPNKGILLEETFRNPPAITKFYSERVYNGRVRSAQATARQRVALPEDPDKVHFIGKESGFVYVPANHFGNRQKSVEEADIVAQVVQELIGREFTNRDGSTIPLSLDDIMIITPYALQKKKLRERLGKHANVGTVHKFQGREAPVTIVSMAVSDANPYSRSMDHWADIRMLHTAISRSRGLVIIVGAPRLNHLRVRTIEDMRRMSFYDGILNAAGWDGGNPKNSSLPNEP